MKLFISSFICLLFSLVFINLTAQKLESYEFLSSRSAIEIKLEFNNILTVPYGVDFYKIRYYTADVNGDEHIASGLLCIPQDDTGLVFPLACYQHGTVSGRDDVPSNLEGGFTLAMAFSAFGYVVCAPDFVGLGDSPGVHPYVHAATEASAGVDFMLAARELTAELEDLRINDQVFITGYSQGGHAAMALQRELELNQSQEFQVTASAPMSGPYSISEAMTEFTLGDDPYQTVAYIAWLSLGYQAAYPQLLEGITLEDIFKPEYIDDIIDFREERIDLWVLNGRMIQTLISTVGTVTPKNTINPEILEALFNDPEHPLSIALADNDVFDWAPNSPTRLLYCQGDDQVTFENALLAEETMIANGSNSVEAVRKDNDVALLDHGGCVLPASLDAINWFNTFQMITNVDGEILTNDNINVRYYDSKLHLDIDDDQFTKGTMSVITMSGKLKSQKSIEKQNSSFEVFDLPEGFYLITISDDRGLLKSSKFVKY